MQTLCQEDEMKQELDERCVIACELYRFNINIYGMRYMDVRMPRMVHQVWLRLCQLKAC